MSGYTDPDVGPRAAASVDGVFLPKPFRADDLTGAVRRALDEPARAEEDVVIA